MSVLSKGAHDAPATIPGSARDLAVDPCADSADESPNDARRVPVPPTIPTFAEESAGRSGQATTVRPDGRCSTCDGHPRPVHPALRRAAQCMRCFEYAMRSNAAHFEDARASYLRNVGELTGQSPARARRKGGRR